MVEITVAPEEEVSSSSSPAGDEYHREWKYDVFLSFRGEDTRKTFVDHLYSALKRNGIHTFKDDQRLETGESISPALLKAIEESRIVIIVFSKNYANSSWCLDELVKIMECRRGSSNSSMGSRTVFPIFYDVEPSDVRNPDKGYLGKILIRKHEPAKVETWREALKEAGSLSGRVLKETADGHEARFIDIVVDKIREKMDNIPSDQDEGLVGMTSRIEEVTSLLDLESDVVRIFGIWGLSGIGKTTLASAVFRRIRNQFQAACFLKEVGEESKRHGLHYLLQQLLSQLLGEKDLMINNDCDEHNKKRRLRYIKVLLVLDDVDNLEQLQKLAKSRDLFGLGSRIIITTKNKRLLDQHKVDQIHEASLLTESEAIRLFNQKAFEDIHCTKEFEHLSYAVIRYADRLPLALEILGSTLLRREISFWENTLERLKEVGPYSDIRAKLKIGFDGLEYPEKEVFLDIACFFEGMEEGYIKRLLDGFGFYPDSSLTILAERSLIYYSNGIVCMHQLIRKMGMHIVCKDFPGEPGKHSRLWKTKEIEFLLVNGTGTENIEGIKLNPRGRERERRIIKIEREAFRNMTNLRLLKIHNSSFRQGPRYLPDGIQWINWENYPSNYLPASFEALQLVGFEMPRSSIIRLWKGPKMMDKLKYINLAGSQKLIETPDFTETPNLEELNLSWCKSLVVVHQSLGDLIRLVFLDLDGCKNLRSLPNSIHSKSLKSFKMAWCESLQKFPKIPVIMEDLSDLHLERTAIRELPLSIENLPNLASLDLWGCQNLASLPSTICKLRRLKQLNLSECSKLDKLPEDLGGLECLEQLYLGETAIKEVPSSIEHHSNLKRLSLRYCKNLRSLPNAVCRLKLLKNLNLKGCSELKKLPEELGSLEGLAELYLDGCKKLEALPELPLSIRELIADDCLSLRVSADRFTNTKNVCEVSFRNCLQLLEEDYTGENKNIASIMWQHMIQLVRLAIMKEIILPGRDIPKWFCQTRERSIFLKFPLNMSSGNFKGYGIGVVFDPMRYKATPFLCPSRGKKVAGVWVHVTVRTRSNYQYRTVHERFLLGKEKIISAEHVCLRCKYFDDMHGVGVGEMDVSIEDSSPNSAAVTKWGVVLLYQVPMTIY